MRMSWLICLLLGACTTLPPMEGDPNPPKMESAFPKQEWTDFVQEQVLEHELHKVDLEDEKEFCPQGMSAKNLVHLIAVMSQRESNHRPNLEYRENFKNSKGEWVISTGLMQISLESARQTAYNCRDFLHTQSDLYDPYVNLKCSINILARWLKRDRRIAGYVGGWKGGARYWSVLRNSVGETKRLLAPWCE